MSHQTSKNTVLAFVQKVNSDAALQRQVTALNGSVDSLIKLAGENGFVFTAKDWQATISGELGDGDLDNVAGGIIIQASGEFTGNFSQGGNQLGDTATHEVGHWMGFTR